MKGTAKHGSSVLSALKKGGRSQPAIGYKTTKALGAIVTTFVALSIAVNMVGILNSCQCLYMKEIKIDEKVTCFRLSLVSEGACVPSLRI